MTNLRPIPGYEGAYSITENGAVYSHRRKIWLKPGTDTAGYKMVVLYLNRKPWVITIHRLVALTYIGPANGMMVLHSDGNQKNNHVSNLRYGSNSDNMQDAVKHGTQHSAKKTHCPRNHPYDEFNTMVVANRRVCKKCRAIGDRAKRLAGMPDPDDPRHGSLNGYSRGCRCDRCYSANSVYQKEYKMRRAANRG